MRLGNRVLVLSVIGTVVGAGALGAGATPPGGKPPAAATRPAAVTTGHGEGSVVVDGTGKGAGPDVGKGADQDAGKGAEQGAAKSDGKGAGKGAEKGAGSAAASGTSSQPASSGSACSSSAAFSQFGDQGRYALLANGTLETGRPARRAGSPAIVSGNESFFLHSSHDTHSLRLRPGDSVAFHATCLPRLDPAFRFVAEAVSGSGALKLEVQYGPAKRLHATPLGTLDSAAYGSWKPTPSLSFLNGSQRLLDQVHGNVWLVLTATGSATWQVDDLYIDPYLNK